MGYKIDKATGIVTNDVDGSQVAPAQSATDPTYLEYINWLAQGNEPADITVYPEQDHIITKFAFRNRFNTEEKIMIDLASIDDPTAPMQSRQMAAALRVYLKDMETAEYVDLDRQDIKNSLAQLSALGIISPARVSVILSLEIEPHERLNSR